MIRASARSADPVSGVGGSSFFSQASDYLAWIARRLWLLEVRSSGATALAGSLVAVMLLDGRRSGIQKNIPITDRGT